MFTSAQSRIVFDQSGRSHCKLVSLIMARSNSSRPVGLRGCKHMDFDEGIVPTWYILTNYNKVSVSIREQIQCST